MNLKNKTICFILTGSFYRLKNSINTMKQLQKKGATIIPVISKSVHMTDTKYIKAQEVIEKIENITKQEVIYNLNQIDLKQIEEQIDIVLITPATGNTIAKLANGISDNIVTTITQNHLKQNKKVIIGISALNGLSTNAENIGKLLNSKNYYFIPYRQDNPITKPFSLAYDYKYTIQTVEKTLVGLQIQPLLL